MYDKFLGEYLKVVKVKSLLKDFGATTSYIGFALDYGEVDGAIVVKADENWKSRAIVVKSSKELKSAIGTKWVITPIMDAIIDALRIERLDKIAIIGTPCQCQAIKDIKDYPMQVGNIFDRISLVVGLYCMGSFTQDGFKTMLERRFGISLPEIKSAEVRMDRFVINLRSGEKKEILIEELKKDIKLACLHCEDFTAVNADISFGNAGARDGWRSAIVRTEHALNILEKAKERKYLYFDELEKEGVEEIREYARKKAERKRTFTL